MVRSLPLCLIAFLLVGCFGSGSSDSPSVIRPSHVSQNTPKGNGEPWTGIMVQISQVGFYGLGDLAAVGESDGKATVVGLSDKGQEFSWIWSSSSSEASRAIAIQPSTNESIVLIEKRDHYEVAAINNEGKQNWLVEVPAVLAQLKTVALSTDGMYIAVAGNSPNPVAFVLDRSGNIIHTLDTSYLQGSVGKVAFLPGSHSLVVGSTSGSGAYLETFKKIEGAWRSSLTSFLPGNSLKFSGGSGKTETEVRIGLATPIETGHLATFETLVSETTISSLTPVGVYEDLDGKLFATTGDLGTFVFRTNDPEGRIISGDSNFSWSLLYELFKLAFGSHVGAENYNRDFDYNNDGFVNNRDYIQFRLRYGSYIIPNTSE